MNERLQFESHEALLLETAAEHLGTVGFSVSTDLLSRELVASLVAEQRRREASGALVVAKVGRGGVKPVPGAVPGVSASREPSPRQAQSSWFYDQPDQSVAERQFLAFAERVRLVINRQLMLGLFGFEAQFLYYPPGGYYRRHIDALHGERSRVVSMVAYLNKDWASKDGGALAVWAADSEGEPLVEVVPLAGTVVLMLSEQIPHEARVALRERRAIAGWYRVNAS
jgi:SM-20-related protein